MPKFTPEKEAKVFESYQQNLNYAKTATEQGVSQKAVRSVVEKKRKNIGAAANGREKNLGSHEGQTRVRSSLTIDKLKPLYTAFLAGKRLPALVAEDGFFPDDVEREYRQFLKLEGLDVHQMQNMVLTRIEVIISTTVNEKLRDTYHKLRKEYANKNYLTIQEFDELVYVLAQLERNMGLDFVRIASMDPPSGWTKPACSRCGKTLASAVIDPHDPLGKTLLEVCRSWFCENCKSHKR